MPAFVVVALIVSLLSGGGAVLVARDVQPSTPLYGLKTALQHAQVQTVQKEADHVKGRPDITEPGNETHGKPSAHPTTSDVTDLLSGSNSSEEAVGIQSSRVGLPGNSERGFMAKCSAALAAMARGQGVVAEKLLKAIVNHYDAMVRSEHLTNSNLDDMLGGIEGCASLVGSASVVISPAGSNQASDHGKGKGRDGGNSPAANASTISPAGSNQASDHGKGKGRDGGNSPAANASID